MRRKLAMSLRITRNIQIGLFTSLNWMWNSGYVIKVEMALSIISVNFWSILTQKVNRFYINVNWFSDIWLCKVVKKYCAVTMSLQSLSDSLNDISCKMSLRNQYKLGQISVAKLGSQFLSILREAFAGVWEKIRRVFFSHFECGLKNFERDWEPLLSVASKKLNLKSEENHCFAVLPPYNSFP